MSIHAGIVEVWGDAPIYGSIDLPAPSEDQVRVKVLSAGVHTVVRSRASGKHFSVARKKPPHVPGTDGVGIIPETNQLVYFNALLAPTGSIAQEINVGKRDVFPLPAGDELMDGSYSTSSGQAAVQISKAFGASEIVTIGKPGPKLDKTKELGAKTLVSLAVNLSETDFSAAADVDVVLDYLWGDVSQAALAGIIETRKNRSQRLTWVEIGALAGEIHSLPASLLRRANVALLGCAPGSWTFPELYAELPKMLEGIVEGGLEAEYEPKKLEDVESWWNETGGARPLVKL